MNNLLLKYISMALPYLVVIKEDDDYESVLNTATLEEIMYDKLEVKPYLRSMSSMTKEEKEELLNLLFDKESKYFYINEEGLIDGKISDLMNEGLNYPSFCPMNIVAYTDWLLKNHFDFMGLIPKSLAIEITNENNPYK